MENPRKATPHTEVHSAGRESGFALIVALLALLLLTFLGLTLAATTSSELQIATNYRWDQQAYYNAESGLEIGRRLLREQNAWGKFLPNPRGASTGLITPQNGPGTGRDFENWQCDNPAVSGSPATVGNQGYGPVLQGIGYPRMENVNFFTKPVNGSFTIWVRRPIQVNNDGTIQDYPKDDRITMTVEGSAPFTGDTSTNTFAFVHRAVRVLDVDVQLISPGDCENLSGQAGNGPTGSGFDPCSKITAKGLPVPGANPTEINPNGQ